ncbi:MAG: HEAT repeat domain-containing protein [Nitrospiraceae bacterium]
MRFCSSTRQAHRFITSGLLTTLLLVAPSQQADARRELIPDEAKARLRQIQHIHLDTLALAGSGITDSSAIAAAVAQRLTTIGYVVVGAADPHEATVKVKCEEHKTWEGTTRSGGDADAPGSTARLWRGPACQVSYRMEGFQSDWRHEIRGEAAPSKGAPPTPTQTATTASAPPTTPTGAAAMALLIERIAQDLFPLLLTSEWGQSTRLLTILEAPNQAAATKTRVIELLGKMAATDAMPALARAIQARDVDVAKAAAVAIGTIGGQDGIPLLLSLFKQGRPELHLAAAQGLGRLAPLHPQTDVVPELLAALPQATVPVQTEIVRALATTADRRSYDAIRRLNKDVQARHATDTSAEMTALQQALGVAIDQFTNTHSSEEQ